MASNLDYRPKSFSEVLGNKDTITALEAILKKKPPHVFLFAGPSGCGKTTLARIVANQLGCSDFDFKEINISDNRGIDTARDIIQTAHLKPMSGKVKVYMLEEVHKATSEFQNAMLKIFEEPPSFVYFILTTTEPTKLLKTVHTRASVFTVAPLNEKKIARLLAVVGEKEGFNLSDKVVDRIVKDSEGSPRKALVMLDQVKHLDEQGQLDVIFAIEKNEKYTIDLCRALLKKESWSTISGIIKGIEDEPEKVRRAVLGYATAVLLNKNDQRAVLMIECFQNHFYDSGKAGLVLSCYQCIF